VKVKTEITAPIIRLRAKSQRELMSATAKKVAALCDTHPSETVLVVYSNKAASLFCESAATPSKADLSR
jgi:hypothetical protein